MASKQQTIILNTTKYPVAFLDFEEFVSKSPSLHHIMFAGNTMLVSPELPDILNVCKKNNITIEFLHCSEIMESNIQPIVKSGIVKHLYFFEQDVDTLAQSLSTIDKLKQKSGQEYPTLVVKATQPEQNTNALPESFGFYNLADNINTIPCAGFIKHPIINYDGLVFGCSENMAGTPINAFKIGIEETLKHKYIKRIKKMLRTGHPDVDLPCCRCPVFASLVWSNKKIRFV